MSEHKTSPVVVVGLAVTGIAVVEHLRAHGQEVVVVDDTAAGAAYEERAAHATVLGARMVERPSLEEAEALGASAALVVPSPGVRLGHPVVAAARWTHVPVRSEVDLAAELLAHREPAPKLVAVTGTNGKTTVTTLMVEMLAAAGVAGAAAGNIGRPLLHAVTEPLDVVVAEVSSFQLELTTTVFSPDVAVLLNVAEDHLDWHGTAEAYAAAKARVFAHMRPDALLVYDADDEGASRLAKMRDGRVAAVSGATPRPPGLREGAAPHDVRNATAAALAAAELRVGPDAIEAAFRGFAGLPHRVALVAEFGGVRWFDDSKATNPHATASALSGFPHVVLLAGGRNKDLDLGVLRVYAPSLRAVVAIGEAAGQVEAAFAGTGVDVTRAGSMRDAVRAAAERAVAGDVVLLSPACASFDWYESYAARGDDFAAEVGKLTEARP